MTPRVCLIFNTSRTYCGRAWTDAERIVVNVHTLYREFSGSSERPNIVELFGEMAALAR